LDLDLDVVAPPAAPAKPLDRTQPLEPLSTQAKPGQPFGDDGSFELPAFELPDLAPAPATFAASAPTSAPPAYDFGDLSLDLGNAGSKAPAEPALDYSSMPAPLDDTPAFAGDPSDPLVRKLDLAEEFRQIGDMEGARDLLEEVVGKADGPLKARAQSLLDSLG
ncbi:MAG: FimV/HubP family polar landmark protein, partial [Burkholderiaceae bacterium]